MNILALDIATKTGWSVFEDMRGSVTLLKHGCVDLSKGKTRALELQRFVKEKIKKHKIKLVLIEDIYFKRNISTFKLLCMFQTTVCLTCLNHNIKVLKSPPSLIRRTISQANNYKKLDKEAVRLIVNKTFGLRLKVKDYDVSDSIAVMLAYINNDKLFYPIEK